MSENNNKNNQVQEQELDINHLMQIRREKLKELQEKGQDRMGQETCSKGWSGSHHRL